MEKLSILVTGGAGYIGAIMVPELLASGHNVTVLDNFMYRQNSLSHVCAAENFSLINGDARQEDQLRPLVSKADVIIPLAALVGAPICEKDPIGARSLNFDAQKMLLEMLSSDQMVLAPITNSGYGVGEKDVLCTENTPLRPVSLYGRHKVEIEEVILSRENSISFRLATVFGMSPRMRLDLLVNDFVYRAKTDRTVVLFESHFKRNYIHVRDVTNVFMHGLRQFGKLKGEAYNVGLSDANLSKRELCEVIRRHIPGFIFLEAEIGQDPDKRDYIVSNDKIESTGFRAKHSLDDGIQELIKGYQMISNSLYTNN